MTPPRYPLGWFDDAACQHYPYLPWDSDGTQSGAKAKAVRRAVMICRRACPVRAECLADADATEVHQADVHGIRGGFTQEVRIERMREGRRAS